MSFLTRITNIIPDVKATLPSTIARYPAEFPGFGSNITLYDTGREEIYIRQGYNRNLFVHSIVAKCAKKFSQVPWYHYKIKTSERKTWQEYVQLTKGQLDARVLVEAKQMRKKSVEEVAVTSPLSKLLNQPNRNQSGTDFREQLYGFKLNTGEGNQWFNRGADPMDIRQPPKEIFLIPRQFLALVKGIDPWDIASYKLVFGGMPFANPKENILMWRFPGYGFDPITLIHLRGMAPLDAGLLELQASNEGSERLAAMNKNQGVAGLAFREDKHDMPTPEQAQFQRQQFNSIVNDEDLAGSIAVMNGQWGFHQFGMNVQQLQLIEQAKITKEGFCNLFDVPPGIFLTDQTYENRKEQKREWIYDNIGPACYGLRDEWNAKLIPEFNLDRERDVIDCDLMALPELTDDLKSQADTLDKMWYLTPNQKLCRIGEEESTDPAMDKIYIPANLVPIDQMNSEIGGPLDSQLNLLNNG